MWNFYFRLYAGAVKKEQVLESLQAGLLASITTTIKTFLCTSIPAIFIASSWRGSGRTHGKKVTRRHVLPSFLLGGWRDTDWFKTRVPDQTHKRLHFIQSVNRPAPSTRRTAVINQIRGLLLERGITVRKGRRHMEAALPGILEDAEVRLSGVMRVLLAQLKLELDDLNQRVDQADAALK